MSSSTSVQVVDSHTAGEPTRIVVSGGPNLGLGPLTARLDQLRTDYDVFRRSILHEPRGSEVLVGGLLCPPDDPASAAAVIFFNDVGYLGMCGHGMIGLVRTLAHLGRIAPGAHTVETPVGPVPTILHADGSVSIRNVPSRCYQGGVSVEVPGYGCFLGSIAWGGNWFFLIDDHPFVLDAANRTQLVAVSLAIRDALAASGITGANGALVDHIELCSPPRDPRNSGRNFVLCPGAAFDRSPCGTGTSARLASLYAAGALLPGQRWRQEGILGTVFEASVEPATDIAEPGWVYPTISGRAHITAESTLLFDPFDPFVHGIVF